MAQTGDACAEAGIYETDCGHAITRRFQVGERFPSCAGCGGGVSWLLVASGVSAAAPRICCPVRREPGSDADEPGRDGGDPCC
jgi:hypothetical protein